MSLFPYFYNLCTSKSVCIYLLSHVKKKTQTKQPKLLLAFKKCDTSSKLKCLFQHKFMSAKWLLILTSPRTAVPKSNKHCCLESFQPGRVSNRQNESKASTPAVF